MVQIKSIAYDLPKSFVTNDEAPYCNLKDLPDFWHEFWGIHGRYIIDRNNGESETSLAVNAAEKAIRAANISAMDLDLIICNTTTESYAENDGRSSRFMPKLACSVKEQIGAENAMDLDLDGACLSFLYNLQVAHNYIKTGLAKNVLIVSSEYISSLLDFTSKSSTPLGDGACAAVITASDSDDFEMIESTYIGKSELFEVASAKWSWTENSEEKNPEDYKIHFTLMEDGQEKMANFVPTNFPITVKDAIKKANMEVSDIDHFIFHQPSKVMLDSWGKTLGISQDKYTRTIADTGCLVSVSVPFTLYNAIRSGAVAKGKTVVLGGVGVGWNFGSQVWRWGETALGCESK